MIADRRVGEGGAEPGPRRLRIEQGFGGVEAFGDEKDERATRVEPVNGAREIAGIGIGAKTQPERAMSPFAEHVGQQARPQIRPANPQMENLREAPAIGSGNGPQAYSFGKSARRGTTGGDFVPQGCRAALRSAQRHVQGRPVLGEIDVRAGKQGRALALDIALSCELHQGRKPFLVDMVLREIRKEPWNRKAHPGETVRFGCKQGRDRDSGNSRDMIAQ